MSATAQTASARPRTMARIRRQAPPEKTNMLRTLVGLLLILWILGLVTSYTMGGAIHILLVLAIVVFIMDRLVPPKSA
jgi:uncharacterized protein DUF5670